MEQRRFDSLTKTLAGRFSRRRALRGLTGSGLALAVSGIAVGGSVVAQDNATPVTDEMDEMPVSLCVQAFEATVRQGPSAGRTIAGTLTLGVEPSGSLTGLLLPEGTVVPTTPEAGAPDDAIEVVGQANGRAVNVLLMIEDGQPIYGVGTSQNDLVTCDGLLGGSFVGPLEGDSGDWVSTSLPPLPSKPQKGHEDACYGCTSYVSGTWHTQYDQAYKACKAAAYCA